jgi:hypothetical protein
MNSSVVWTMISASSTPGSTSWMATIFRSVLHAYQTGLPLTLRAQR